VPARLRFCPLGCGWEYGGFEISPRIYKIPKSNIFQSCSTTPGKVDFDTMPRNKAKEPQDSGDERPRRLRFLQRIKKKGPVNTDAAVSTAVSSTVPNALVTANINQTKSIAIEDDQGVSITASNPVTTTPATTTLNQPSPAAAKADNASDLSTVSISLPATLVPANVNQPKTVTKEENARDSTTTATSVATKVNTTKPIAEERNTTDSTTMDKTKAPLPKQPLQQAIKRLNTSIEGLCKIKEFLDHDLKNIKIDSDWWEKPANAKPLDIKAMDSEIDKVSKLTDRLLSDRRAMAESQDARQGILPATENFLKTAGHALSYPTKVILTSLSQVSGLVQPSSDEVNQ